MCYDSRVAREVFLASTLSLSASWLPRSVRTGNWRPSRSRSRPRYLYFFGESITEVSQHFRFVVDFIHLESNLWPKPVFTSGHVRAERPEDQKTAGRCGHLGPTLLVFWDRKKTTGSPWVTWLSGTHQKGRGRWGFRTHKRFDFDGVCRFLLVFMDLDCSHYMWPDFLVR